MLSLVPNQPSSDEIAQGRGAGTEQRESHCRNQNLPNRGESRIAAVRKSNRFEQGGKRANAAAKSRCARDIPIARSLA